MPDQPSSYQLPSAWPYWLCLGLVPLVLVSAVYGGWLLLLIPLYAWGLFSILDLQLDLDENNPDISKDSNALFWHLFVTRLWPFLQLAITFGLLAFVSMTDHLSSIEKISLFLCVGILNGTIGIVFAHDLIHRTNRLDRLLGDLQLAMVLYGHYRSEHLLVHHRHVGTPRDPVTARYKEHFWRFYPRVLVQSLVSSYRAEAALLARRGLPAWHLRNPFWQYVGSALVLLILAFLIAGWTGVALFMTSAGFAIFQLELVNYIEHYGLTRKHLDEGKYEPQGLQHSWNSAHSATSRLLINVTRHSDHHSSPSRPFPLLQTPDEDEAPHLPYGYAIMTTMALIPPLWMRVMNPKVRAWRRRFYPEISDWSSYDRGSNPVPVQPQ